MTAGLSPHGLQSMHMGNGNYSITSSRLPSLLLSSTADGILKAGNPFLKWGLSQIPPEKNPKKFRERYACPLWVSMARKSLWVNILSFFPLASRCGQNSRTFSAEKSTPHGHSFNSRGATTRARTSPIANTLRALWFGLYCRKTSTSNQPIFRCKTDLRCIPKPRALSTS